MFLIVFSHALYIAQSTERLNQADNELFKGIHADGPRDPPSCLRVQVYDGDRTPPEIKRKDNQIAFQGITNH